MKGVVLRSLTMMLLLLIGVGGWGGAAFSAGGGDAVPSNFSQREKSEIQQIVHDYLMDNPKVLQEVSAKLSDIMDEEQRVVQAAAIGKLKGRFVEPGVTPILGNQNGTLDIVVFFDYNCGYCRHALPLMEDLAKRNPDLRVVIREYPIFGPDSEKAAAVALATFHQGKYAQFHHALTEVQGDKIDQGVAEDVAQKLGLDMDALRAYEGGAEVNNEIEASYGLAQALGLRGTPAFIIGDRVIPGMMPIEGFQQVIDEVRKAKK